MQDFPDFMKSKSNHLAVKSKILRISTTIFYEGADCSQMAFWTCYSDRVSKKHTHEFD